jgi:uncharacterized protein YybS (DUF2232 family)
MKRIKSVLKYIWQLPQNIIALIYLSYLIVENQIPAITKYKEIKVYTKYSSGSVTLGNYIFISSKATENTIKHEYGHTRQSLYLGPLYIIIIGIPSILWAMIHKTIAPDKLYSWFYTEAWADKLGNVK